jgi:hypothetical protein
MVTADGAEIESGMSAGPAAAFSAPLFRIAQLQAPIEADAAMCRIDVDQDSSRNGVVVLGVKDSRRIEHRPVLISQPIAFPASDAAQAARLARTFGSGPAYLGGDLALAGFVGVDAASYVAIADLESRAVKMAYSNLNQDVGWRCG